MTKELWDAWMEGRGAWCRGVARRPNPRSNPERRAWDDGWHFERRVKASLLKERRRLGDYTAWPKQLKDVKP